MRTLTDDRRRRALKLGPAPERLQGAIDRYLAHRRNVVAENTVAADKAALRHLAEVVGQSTAGVTLDAVQQLVDQSLERGYAASSVRTWITSIAPFVGWLGLPFDVWECVLPERSETEVATWSDDELVEIRKAADRVDRQGRERSWPPARLVVETFLGMGVRQMEGFAVEWQRISAREKTVRVVYQMRKANRQLIPLKGKQARTALILPSFFDYVTLERSGFVLRKLYYGAQTELLKRVLDAAGLNDDGVGYHRFRHTYARLFVEQGGRLEELRISLGHKSILTTERSYSHYQEDVAASMARRRIYRVS